MKRKMENKMVPNYSKITGELMSYRFFFCGKNALTGATKLYTMTWAIPKSLVGKKEIERARDKAKVEFDTECEKKSLGLAFEKNSKIMLNDFADEWLSKLKDRPESHSSYSSAKERLTTIKQFFAGCLIDQISPRMIANFYKHLGERTYIKAVVTVKRPIKEFLKEKQITMGNLANDCDLNRLTIQVANKVGVVISKETATRICDKLKIDFNDYFNIQEKKFKYALATNKGVKTVLVMILNSARKQMLIEHNFATKEFQDGVTGTVKEKQIYDEQGAKEFLKCVANEPDIRKRTMFYIFIFLGLRNGEVCGLEWNDIDLDNRQLTINRNSIYCSEFGTYTKTPKTKNSKRTLTIPMYIVPVLNDYKAWWDTQQIAHGDLWVGSKRLFLQETGEPINPSTPRNWLAKFQYDNNLAHIPPHSLRHTNITLQVLAGVPIKTVSKRAGHANENITLSIYTHLQKGDDEKGADKFNDFMTKII